MIYVNPLNPNVGAGVNVFVAPMEMSIQTMMTIKIYLLQ
jgi:hypothetical protein